MIAGRAPVSRDAWVIPRVVFRSRSGDRDRGENCSTTCKDVSRTKIITSRQISSNNVARSRARKSGLSLSRGERKGHEHRGVTASHNFYMPICGKHQVPRTLSAEAHANAMSFSSHILISRQLFVLHRSRESINCALHVRDLWLSVLPRWQFHVNVHMNSSFFTSLCP